MFKQPLCNQIANWSKKQSAKSKVREWEWDRDQTDVGLFCTDCFEVTNAEKLAERNV